MNLYKKEKSELIKEGKFQDYLEKKKDAFYHGFTLSDNPDDFGLSELELQLIRSLEKSTKRKKADFRRHTYFMSEYYDNIGLLTLTYSDRALDKSTFDTKKEQVTSTLKECFLDYIGKFEISPSGRLHFHAIVAWNGKTKTRTVYRDGHSNQLVINKNDLTDLWHGGKDIEGQPLRYGVYDLILVPDNKSDKDKATNYTLKSLNTMESYIQKDEAIDLHNVIDDELLYQVNTSNILTARGTPYQQYKNDQDEQDKLIKYRARVFDTPFYELHKYDGKKIFRDWALDNQFTNISLRVGEHTDLLGADFKLINPDMY